MQRKLSILGAVGLLALSTQLSQASVSIALGNNPQPNEENILLNTGSTGSTVLGVGNQSNIEVAFSSLTDVLAEPANGQARIEAIDGLLNNVTITVPGGSFGALIMNPLTGSGILFYTIVANEPGGGTMTLSGSAALGNGNNFVTIVASAGETLASVTLDSPAGFTDLRQVRISDAAKSGRVPDSSSSLALLATGIAGLSLAFRRSRRCRA